MAKRRFAAVGQEWSNGLVTLDRRGREFDTEQDAQLIASICRDGAGGLVVEIPTLAEQNSSLRQLVASQLADVVEEEVQKRLSAQRIQRVSAASDLEQELAFQRENEQARKDTAAAYERDIAQHKAAQKAKSDGQIAEWTAKTEARNKTATKATTKKPRASKSAKSGTFNHSSAAGQAQEMGAELP